MMHLGVSPSGRRAVAGFVAIVLALASAGFVTGATTTKTYTPSATSSLVRGGTYVSASLQFAAIDVAITNNTDPQSIGSVNILVPQTSDLTILKSDGTVASAADGSTCFSVTPAGTACYTTGNVTINGTTLHNKKIIAARNLGLAFNATAHIGVQARIGCGSTSSVTWQMEVKQSNDFSGLPGNDFLLSGSYPTTTFTGACTLSITSPGPQDAVKGDTITTVDFDTSVTAARVSAEVLTGDLTNVVIWWGGTVNLSKVFGPTATLSGASVSAISGVATFSSFSINNPGTYVVKAVDGNATVVLTPSSDSASFNIVDNATNCDIASCTVTDKGNRGKADITAASGTGFLSISMGGAITLCNADQTVGSDAISFNITGTDDGKTVTATINRSFAIKPASNYSVCLRVPESSGTFTVLGGADAPLITDGGVNYYEGVLPDCTDTLNAPPCVVSRSVVKGGVQIVFTTKPGDPVGKAF